MKEREKIRYRLSINHLSFAWLIDMLRKRGIYQTGVQNKLVMLSRAKQSLTRAIIPDTAHSILIYG